VFGYMFWMCLVTCSGCVWLHVLDVFGYVFWMCSVTCSVNEGCVRLHGMQDVEWFTTKVSESQKYVRKLTNLCFNRTIVFFMNLLLDRYGDHGSLWKVDLELLGE